MDQVNQLRERLAQLQAEETRLEKLLTSVQREINKYQVERMHLISQQRMQNGFETVIVQASAKELRNLDHTLNRTPLDLDSKVVHYSDVEEEDSD